MNTVDMWVRAKIIAQLFSPFIFDFKNKIIL